MSDASDIALWVAIGIAILFLILVLIWLFWPRKVVRIANIAPEEPPLMYVYEQPDYVHQEFDNFPARNAEDNSSDSILVIDPHNHYVFAQNQNKATKWHGERDEEYVKEGKRIAAEREKEMERKQQEQDREQLRLAAADRERAAAQLKLAAEERERTAKENWRTRALSAQPAPITKREEVTISSRAPRTTLRRVGGGYRPRNSQ